LQHQAPDSSPEKSRECIAALTYKVEWIHHATLPNQRYPQS
jgi:hypothetical protein